MIRSQTGFQCQPIYCHCILCYMGIVAVCAGLLLLHASCMHGKEAQYDHLLPVFELNHPGYLFHIGTGKYIGIAPGIRNRLAVRSSADDALRLRAYLSADRHSQALILLQDKRDKRLQTLGPRPSDELLHTMPVLGLCSDTVPRKIVLMPYNKVLTSSFFFTPSIFASTGRSFQIMAGDGCMEIDAKTQLLDVHSCITDPDSSSARRMQLFSWVDADMFNRGIDPPTNKAIREIGSLFRHMSRSSLGNVCRRYLEEANTQTSSSVPTALSYFASSSTLPYPNPYSISKQSMRVPAICARYIRENYVSV